MSASQDKTAPARALDGKVAIVTGAGRGLGRAEAIALAAAGARVVVNDLGGGLFGEAGADNSVAESVVREIREQGGEAVANGESVSDMAGARRLIEVACDSFGRLDILVNNAGIARPHPIWDMSEEDWDKVIAVHLKGHFTTIRHAAPLFRKQRSGVIVNTSSESGLGHLGMSNYSAAKEGILGLTRAVARDLGRYGIRCNAIRPRALTRMAVPEIFETLRMSQEELGFPVHGKSWVGMDEINPPENVAPFVVWLCTDAAVRANGRTFFVGGGRVALYSEPEPVRTLYREEGWDLAALNDKRTVGQLLEGLENEFLGPPNWQETPGATE